MKRRFLILMVAAMTVAMTLGAAGLAGAQEEVPGAPSADELFASMSFYQDPEAPNCWYAFGSMYVCTAP